jgi:hypothetical protein
VDWVVLHVQLSDYDRRKAGAMQATMCGFRILTIRFHVEFPDSPLRTGRRLGVTSLLLMLSLN